MSYDKSSHLPAPCIIDSGIIVNKKDMQGLLRDLEHVRYHHFLDGNLQSEGEGYVIEVFADSHQSTLVANHALYINVGSFDYLQLHQSPEQQTYLDLIQDFRQLRLIPTSNLLQEKDIMSMDAEAIEAMVTQVLSAKRDVQFDDDDYPF